MKAKIFLYLLVVLFLAVGCGGGGGGTSSSGGSCSGNESQITVQTEDGTGSGQIMSRSAAFGQATVLLMANESRAISFTPCLKTVSNFKIKVRYSNDNFGPSEIVAVSINGNFVGQFIANSTGSFGEGWNNFFDSPYLGNILLQPNTRYSLTIAVSGGDGRGIEIDCIIMDKV
jgi:hypothetical protein